jgi:4-hydroxy-3-methylbut-2-enyl diphosphate reductase
MEIVLADVYGFCFGVKRAIETAERAQDEQGGEVHTLGPLIHNRPETERLAGKGVKAVEDLEGVKGGALVIRTHGIPPDVRREVEGLGLKIIDATCPFVAKSQRVAALWAKEDRDVVIVGNPTHPEVRAVVGFARGRAQVVQNAEEVDLLPRHLRPGLLAQTTANEETFNEIVRAMRSRYHDLVVSNTICGATRERQGAARELAERVDMVYVVGGRDSSNANKLLAICLESAPRSRLIERASEIDPADLAGVERVGVTASASTPDWVIEEVVRKLDVEGAGRIGHGVG